MKSRTQKRAVGIGDIHEALIQDHGAIQVISVRCETIPNEPACFQCVATFPKKAGMSRLVDATQFLAAEGFLASPSWHKSCVCVSWLLPVESGVVA